MERRALLGSVSAATVGLAGCSLLPGCRGDLRAVELTDPKRLGSAVLEFDSRELSAEERTALDTATEKRVLACSRDEDAQTLAVESLFDRIKAHPGTSSGSVKGEPKYVTPARYDGTRYTAVAIWDGGEGSGGPLGN